MADDFAEKLEAKRQELLQIAQDWAMANGVAHRSLAHLSLEILTQSDTAELSDNDWNAIDDAVRSRSTADELHVLDELRKSNNKPYFVGSQRAYAALRRAFTSRFEGVRSYFMAGKQKELTFQLRKWIVKPKRFRKK